jgi:ligand-binding SRPBCC domain-containing protein
VKSVKIASIQVAKMYTLHNNLWLKASIDDVWAFGSNPKNLAGISPKFMNLSVQAQRDGTPQNGDLVAIQIRPLKLFRISWDSRIGKVNASGEKRQFVDIQEKGPFKTWEHVHRFESGKNSNGDLGTWIYDDVSYSVPYSIFGKIGHALLLNFMLKQMFVDRNKAFLKHFHKT